MKLVRFGTACLLLLSCTTGQIAHDGESLMLQQESSLRGKQLIVDDNELGTRTKKDIYTTVERDLTSSKKQDSTIVREGRSHVREGAVGDSLGRKEEVLDSTGEAKTTKPSSSVASKAVSASTKSSEKRPSIAEAKGTSSTGTKEASTGTKKEGSREGKATSSSNGKAAGKDSATKDVTTNRKKKTIESDEDESEVSDAGAKKHFSSYSSGVYSPSICGTSRTAVEEICNTDRPICKYETKQASGHEPFHIMEKLRPNQGDCIRRCDSKWGLSEKHCLQGEECHEGLVACTKCSILYKPGCEPF